METVESPRVSWRVDERFRAHGVVFDDPAVAVAAVGHLRAEGYAVVEAYTPFAVHGMDEALGFEPTKLGWGTLAGGIAGGVLGLGFPIWTHAVDWPLNIGGKGFIAWQAIIPVAFEMVILLAAFATLGTLFAASRLRPRTALGTPSAQPLASVSDNHVVLLVSENDGSFDWEHFSAACKSSGAHDILEGWRVT